MAYKFFLAIMLLTCSFLAALYFENEAEISGEVTLNNFLVKKSNTPLAAVGCNPLKFGAKGDGISDDTFAIQTAIDSCKVVSFSPGSYKISALTINHPGLELKGNNVALLIATGNNNLLYSLNQSGIKISGFSFVGANISTTDGDGQAIYLKNVKGAVITNNKFSNFMGAGIIRIEGGSSVLPEPPAWSEQIKITNNSFYNNMQRSPLSPGVASNAIYLVGGVKNFEVSNNYIDAEKQRSGIALLSNIRNGKVFKNTIHNVGINFGMQNYGIFLYDVEGGICSDVEISSNIIVNVSKMCIYIQAHSAGGNIFVKKNQLSNCDINAEDSTLPSGAISVNEGKLVFIEGNIIKGINEHSRGIQIVSAINNSSLTIRGNSIDGGKTGVVDTIGIKIASGSGIIISENIIGGVSMGIGWTQPAGTSVISNVSIISNKILNVNKGIGFIIYISPSAPVGPLVLSRNLIANISMGINSYLMFDSVIYSNKISGVHSPDNFGAAVFLQNSGRNTISQNIINSCDHGIYQDPSDKSNIISGNIIGGCLVEYYP